MDTYKVGMLKKMLEHEESKTEEQYGAKLKHWYGDTKTLDIDAGGLRCLIDYYSKCNEQKPEPWTVCFHCSNRKSEVCQKCTRNSFAPCGQNKEDYFNSPLKT